MTGGPKTTVARLGARITRPLLLVMLITLPLRVHARHAEILWDSWDVPHIYASTDADAFYGIGWAQAESYGRAILEAYSQTRGEASRFLGDDSTHLDSDKKVRVLNVAAVAKDWTKRQSPAFSIDLKAFVAGINDFFSQHPERIPDGLRELLPIQVSDVLGNVFRSWFVGSGWEAETRSWALNHGWNSQIALNTRTRSSSSQTGSNAIAIAASRSVSGRAMLLINPHVNFNERWFEAQIVTPHMNFTGVTVPGLPVMLCGFNDHLGWAITNNQAIRRTTFEVTLTKNGYMWDAKPVLFKRRHERIRVRRPDGTIRNVMVPVEETVLGPVIDHLLGVSDHNRALVMRVSGFDRPGMLEEYWAMQNATSIDEFESAVERMQVPFLNHIYADRQGHILFQYLGLIPKTAASSLVQLEGIVLPGQTSQSLWQGYLPYSALPRAQDPLSGWLQNANDPPWTTTIPEVLVSDQYSLAIANNGPVGFRPQRAIEMLQMRPHPWFEDLIRMKQDTHVTAADRVLPDLLLAARASDDALVRQAAAVLEAWDGNVLPTSRGAVLFYEWFKEMHLGEWGADGASQNRFAIQWRADHPADTPSGLADPALGVIALRTAAKRVLERYRTLDVAWGAVYRVRIAGQDLPANGGPDDLGVYRVVDHFVDDDRGHRVAQYGDSYSMIVEFSPRPHALALLTTGNSEQPASHAAIEQAQLFSAGSMRPVWRERVEIEAHLQLRETPRH
jgi:acyl-homoserine-lactone acylase